MHVLNRSNGEWVEIEKFMKKNQIVVLCGETLQRMTSNMFIAGTHSVESSKTIDNFDEERYSEVFSIRTLNLSFRDPIINENFIHPSPIQNNIFHRAKFPDTSSPISSSEFFERRPFKRIAYNVFYNERGEIIYPPIPDN